MSSAYFTTSWPAAPIAWMNNCPVKGGSPNRSRTAALSIENPPGPSGKACSQVASTDPSPPYSRSHSRTGPAP